MPMLERKQMSEEDDIDYNLVRFVFDLRKKDAFGTVNRPGFAGGHLV